MIYQTRVTEGCDWALPVDDRDFETLDAFAERQSSAARVPVDFRLIPAERDALTKACSMPWLDSRFLILRDGAIIPIGELLKPYGDLVPLACDDADLVLFLARERPGLLNLAKSEVVRFSTGRIMTIPRPAFHLDGLEPLLAFRSSEFPTQLFLTERLVEAIASTGVATGTAFEPVASPVEA